MRLDKDSRYLFWFRTKQQPDKITELKKILDDLGVKYGIIEDMTIPEIIEFEKAGNKAVVGWSQVDDNKAA